MRPGADPCRDRQCAVQTRTIESPSTATALLSSGSVAGPLATVPSRLYLLPWQGQSIVPSATLFTAHPLCVHFEEKPLKSPAVGWVMTTSSTMTPDPTGTSAVLAIAPPGASAGGGVVTASSRECACGQYEAGTPDHLLSWHTDVINIHHGPFGGLGQQTC